MKESLLKVSSPWWFWAVFALIFGFGFVQDNAKRLSGSTGWSLAGTWFAIVCGVFVFVFASYVAILKYRSRGVRL